MTASPLPPYGWASGGLVAGADDFMFGVKLVLVDLFARLDVAS